MGKGGRFKSKQRQLPKKFTSESSCASLVMQSDEDGISISLVLTPSILQFFAILLTLIKSISI